MSTPTHTQLSMLNNIEIQRILQCVVIISVYIVCCSIWNFWIDSYNEKRRDGCEDGRIESATSAADAMCSTRVPNDQL